MPKQTRGDNLRPIDPRILYPLPVFEEHSGLSKAAMRTARRNGLRVLRVGGRAFVLGSDFIEYVLKAQSADQSNT